jgi:hypothetical protein
METTATTILPTVAWPNGTVRSSPLSARATLSLRQLVHTRWPDLRLLRAPRRPLRPRLPLAVQLSQLDQQSLPGESNLRRDGCLCIRKAFSHISLVSDVFWVTAFYRHAQRESAEYRLYLSVQRRSRKPVRLRDDTLAPAEPAI